MDPQILQSETLEAVYSYIKTENFTNDFLYYLTDDEVTISERETAVNSALSKESALLEKKDVKNVPKKILMDHFEKCLVDAENVSALSRIPTEASGEATVGEVASPSPIPTEASP